MIFVYCSVRISAIKVVGNIIAEVEVKRHHLPRQCLGNLFAEAFEQIFIFASAKALSFTHSYLRNALYKVTGKGITQLIQL